MRAFFTLLCTPIISLLIPIQMARANRQVAIMDIETSSLEALSEDVLSDLINSEWVRAKELDEKLYKLTAALSVALPVSGLVGSTMLQNLDYSLPKIIAVFLYLCAALLLTVGVALGFNGIIPKKRYGYGAKYAGKIAEGGEAAKSEMVAAAREYERDNIIRANETTAAVVSIRNGVLVFALGTVVNLYALSVSVPGASEGPNVILVELSSIRGF